MVNTARFALLVGEYTRNREALLAEFPELAEDPTTLADTLEGESALPDVISSLIRDARKDEALATALGSMLSESRDRKARLEHRASRRRSIALALMQSGGVPKLEAPDFTASIRAVTPSVQVTDAEALPNGLYAVLRVPDKAKIKEALAQGPVAGAHMSNGGSSLTIRTR